MSALPSPGGSAPGASEGSPLVRSLVTGITVFRLACLVWLIAVLVATRDDIARPAVAIVLTQVVAAVSILWWVRLRQQGAASLLSPTSLAVDVGVATGLGVFDGVVYDGPHPLSLGSAWPLASVLSAGVALGARGGAVAGAIVGVGRAVGDVLEPGGGWSFDEVLSRTSTLFLYCLAGAMAGYAVRRLLDAEREVAMGRARDEVARTLHDGVLQTLAVLQRRSDDTELVRLAQRQERELRSFLFGDTLDEDRTDLGAALRRVAARAEERDGTTIRVVVAPDVPQLDATVVHALAGAVGEACTNAAKHGGARTVTVYAEPDDDSLVCSVKDDGSGFEPGTAEGSGITGSIRGRLADVGGSATIDPNPGHGTEVVLRAPVGTSRTLGS